MPPLPRTGCLLLLALLATLPARAQTPGSVLAWGDDTSGQTSIPAGTAAVRAVAAGTSHSLALTSDGTVVAWGSDAYDQATVPSGLDSVAAIAAGGVFSLALRADGSVVKWGFSTYAPRLRGVRAIAAGFRHSLGLRADGTVVGWGDNIHGGGGGDNDHGQATVPDGLGDVVEIAAGGFHSLALKGDGTVVAWGLDHQGQATVPAGLTEVVAVAAGDYHSLALKSDGTVVAWGTPDASVRITPPDGLSGVVALASGGGHALALQADGRVVAWGSDDNGEGTVPAALPTATSIAAGGSHSLAVVPEGTASRARLAVGAGRRLFWPLETIPVRVDMIRADGLQTLAAVVGYDPTRVTYAAGSLTAGDLFASGTPQASESDDPAGALGIRVLRADGTAASGDGALAALSFQVADHAAPGTAAFSLPALDLFDAARRGWHISDVSGDTIEVGGVWPGDLDNDCTATEDDLLPLARALAAPVTGPARPNAGDVSWTAMAFSPWGGSASDTRFPLSFVDADGDGFLDDDDAHVIAQNLSLTRDATTGCAPPSASASFEAGPRVVVLGGAPGATVAFEVELSDLEGLLFASARLAGRGATVIGVEPGAPFEGGLEVVRMEGGGAVAAFALRGAPITGTGGGPLLRVIARVDAPGAEVELSRLRTAALTGEPTTLDPSGDGVGVTEPRAVSVDEPPGMRLAVTLVPNPAGSTVRLAVTAPEAGAVEIAVFDALGRRVARVERTVAAGASTIDLPVSSLAPGLYVLRVQAAGQVVSRTLTVAR